MKNVVSTVMALLLITGAWMINSSCNNAGKKSAENAADSLASAAKNTVQSFSSQMKDFDSTWTSTMMVLNQRIQQWDSTAKTYKGPIKMKMEKQIAAVKAQRDSLKTLLGQSAGQSQSGWTGFTQAVTAKYDTILVKMNNLSTANQ